VPNSMRIIEPALSLALRRPVVQQDPNKEGMFIE
jgi:hypothetical protein